MSDYPRPAIVKIDGKRFCCPDCGCSVFTETSACRYKCNGCSCLFFGESKSLVSLIVDKKEQVTDAIKVMLLDHLDFDTYRKQIFENYWPTGVEEDEEMSDYAKKELKRILGEVRTVVEPILRKCEHVGD